MTFYRYMDIYQGVSMGLLKFDLRVRLLSLTLLMPNLAFSDFNTLSPTLEFVLPRTSPEYYKCIGGTPGSAISCCREVCGGNQGCFYDCVFPGSQTCINRFPSIPTKTEFGIEPLPTPERMKCCENACLSPIYESGFDDICYIKCIRPDLGIP